MASLLLVASALIAYYAETISSIEGFWNTTGKQACYYLTSVEPAKLLGAKCSIAVVEPEETPSWLVERLRGRGVTVLAYINAGYAEEWRSYWKTIHGKPWVHGETGYEGEYYVEYWRDEWRNIVSRLAARYVGQGYSGIYLDNIDAAMVVVEEDFPWARGVNTTRAMIGLVCSIAGEARRAAGNESLPVFINIGGAVSMLYDNTLLSCIDGVLREELWRVHLGGNRTGPQDCSETLEALDALAYAKSHGKTIIVSDPVLGERDALRFCRRAWSHGFIPVPQPAWLYDYSSPPPPDWCAGGGGGD